MIFVWLLEGVSFVVDAIFTLLGVLPNLPNGVIDIMEWFFNLIFGNGLGLVCLFLPIDYIKAMIPILIAVINFEHIYHAIMWVLRKIPMAGIE